MYEAVEKTDVQVSKNIFPAEAWELISTEDKEDLVILDVSTPMEYRGLHLQGAINVSLFSRFFKARLGMMDREKTYVVYCKVGGRSSIVQKMMARMGFRRVYNVIGGTMLWEDEGLPFAQGTGGTNISSFCPVVASLTAYKKVKTMLRGTCSCFAREEG
ncbi:MAG: rhodanese-like domain-containing protein [Deltaproteobacteria bacterium]|nr:rhodanese-like domain-containing protein [Deltaproteobacteria bacterium]